MDVLSAYKKEFSGLFPKGAKGRAALRREGFEAFLVRGFPGPKAEDWRYADLQLLRSRHLKKTSVKTLGKKITPVTRWPLLVIENGVVTQLPKGLDGIGILSAPGKVSGYESCGLSNSPLERLNLAFSDSGLVLKIKKKAKIEGLEIVLLNAAKKGEAIYPRNLIRMEEGARATLFIRTLETGQEAWVNQVTNFSLDKKAELSLIRDFEADPNSLLTIRDFAALKEQASFRAFALMGGLSSLRYEIEIALLGKEASAEYSGGMLAGAGNTIDVITRLHHIKGATTSNQTFKGVAGDKGKSAFQGRVLVEENAQKIEAHQTCHNLILDRGGEANVKPELLIFADDVICSHGATVGEVDKDALFYMMQRGLSENQARSILVQAFLGEVIENIENGAIRAHMAQKVEAWMAENLK